MQDSFGRDINYLRISITDRCNLRCLYCMPHGIVPVDASEILRMEEIIQITKAAAEAGIRHIKVTGGEPLVRKGCCAFIQKLKCISGIETVTLTTNGMLLEQYLAPLISAGIDGINISMDTCNEKLFRRITGGGEFSVVLSGLEKAVEAKIPVKINAVSFLWKEFPEAQKEQEAGRDWQDIVEMANRYPVDVRFIEMMPIGYGTGFQSINHEELKKQIRAIYPQMQEDVRKHGFGPARYYRIPGFLGSIGFISAIHENFCGQCNRIRLTSQGYLKTCLCYEQGVNLRGILQSGTNEAMKRKELVAAIRKAVWEKPAHHCFNNPGSITETRNMSSIGG